MRARCAHQYTKGLNMANNKKCCEGKDPARLNKVGGQAVLEGVMMKAGTRTVTTCRKDDGTLTVKDGKFISVRTKHKFLNIPILRGIVNLVEMLLLSYKTLGFSAEALGLDEEVNKKPKKEGAKEKKSSTTDIVMIIGMVLGVLLAVGLFIVLPGLVSDLVEWIFSAAWGIGIHAVVKAIIEGAAKVGIFIAYLALVSLMPDIKRTFMYHGAEHKSIACFESGADLTPENARNYTRFHPRCGTSFMFVMILLGVVVGIFVNLAFGDMNRLVLSGIRLLILPIVVGLGYEFIMFAGKHDNVVTRALSAPGLWMQRLTTKEPTDDMLEVAIISIKCALRDDFPEFREFYENREWEPKVEEISDEENTEATETTDEAAEASDAEVPATESADDEAV